ncbi:MAG: glycosyltransferase family 2 protein [Actinomycetes bacterium]
MPVDILVPFYGDPGLLRQTVASVQAQLNKEWHLTVVDDGYDDPGVSHWFDQLQDARVTYIRNEQNLGANANYVKCVSLATHDAFVVLGADDLLLPNFVDVVLRARRQFPGAAVVQPGVVVIGQDSRPRRTLVDSGKRRYAPRVTAPTVLGGEELANSLMRGNWLYFPSLCFDRRAVQHVDFRAGLDVVQDLALVLDLMMRGERLVVDPEVCFAYRRHTGSDSSQRALEGTRFTEEGEYFLEVADELQALGWHRAARTARRHLSSRLNAATMLPAALRTRRLSGARRLGRHVMRRPT